MRKLSRNTIERTLLYIRTLESLAKAKRHWVSSKQLAEILGSSDVQIRKEISKFGKIGKPRIGYDVSLLKQILEDFLLSGRVVRAVLFGAGNLGNAILRYPGFAGRKIRIVAAFDRDTAKIGHTIHGVRIFSVIRAPEVIRKTRANLGILAVPEESSQEAADLMVISGLRAIANFAPTSINVPKNVVVKDIDLSIEFLSIFCGARLT